MDLAMVVEMMVTAAAIYVVYAVGRFWVDRKYADPKIVARVDTQESALKNALAETRAEIHRLQAQIDQLKQKLAIDAQNPPVDQPIFNWRS